MADSAGLIDMITELLLAIAVIDDSGFIDSCGSSEAAQAMRLLEREGRIEIHHDDRRRRVIGRMVHP